MSSWKNNDRTRGSNRKLRDLDVLKNDFVSMVSHELRTPLTSIIGLPRPSRPCPSYGTKTKYLDIIEAEGSACPALSKNT